MAEDDFERLKNLQELAKKSVKSDNKQDKEIEIRVMILDLTRSNRPIQVEEILTQGELRGINSSKVREVIQQLISEKILIEPQDGYVQRNIY